MPKSDSQAPPDRLDPGQVQYNPDTQPGMDRWHRQNNPPPPNPGGAPRENVTK